jgi:N-acetylglucosaminyldiphosphoundecaprenol N-acetyl-beta-D-mannosaminyltransferase
MKLYKILGVNCYQFNSVSDAKAFIKDIIISEDGGYSVAINAEKIMMYSKDINFRAIIDHSILPIPDGSGAIIGMKILYNINSIKLDLPKTIFECANESKFSLFVLGATEKVNFNTENSLNQKYPDINLVGRQNGYFDDELVVFQQIKKLNPQIVVIAMGSPKQEKLAARLNEILPSALLIGCGGAFNILTGEVKRAPVFYQKNHLEWFYRLVKEPSRFKRQLILPVFLLKLIIKKFSRK